MKITELYKQMLSSIGMVVDNQGFVSSHVPGADISKPLLVGQRRLVLPYKEQMDQPDWSNRAGFHPLLQNFSSGDSPVLDAVRSHANRHFDFIFGMTFLDLAHLAAARDQHKNLTPEQAKYLRPVSGADEKFTKILTTIVSAKQAAKKGFEFVRFSVVMGRSWQGQKRHRVAVATFPLYEQLPAEDKPCVIAGQKLSIKQTKMLRDMYEFFFPHIKEKGYYEVGSDSKFGPSIEALFGLLDIMIHEHNKHISVLDGAIRGADYLYVPNEWSETLKDIPSMVSEIRAIPALEGNAGRGRVGTAAAAAVSDQAVQTHAAPTVVADKASSVPIITNVPAMTQAIQEQATAAARPRIRLGVDPTESADPRTQLPNDVAVVAPSVINTAGYRPTPPAGSQLQAMQAAQQPVRQQAAFGNLAGNVLQQQPQAAGPVVTKIPDSARMINGAMYIPLEVQGAAIPPAGSIIYDNKVYVPFAQGGGFQQPQQMQRPGFGQGGNVLNQGGGLPDPAQIQGLSQGEIEMYRGNPALFANFLQNMQVQQQSQFANQQMQRQQQTPPYMRRLMEQAQAVQQQNRFGLGR